MEKEIEKLLWEEYERVFFIRIWNSTLARINFAQPEIRPNQNSIQNQIWIIQKCIQSISNSYSIVEYLIINYKARIVRDYNNRRVQV